MKYDGRNKAVRDIVKALVAEYDNREAAAKRYEERGDQYLSPEYLERFKAINTTIDECLNHVSPSLREELRRDIASGRGYKKSEVAASIGVQAFYELKGEAVRRIVKAFRLVLDLTDEKGDRVSLPLQDMYRTGGGS